MEDLPNALIFNQGLINISLETDYLLSLKILGDLPNIKKNKAYYYAIIDSNNYDNLRVVHIKRDSVIKEYYQITKGNSFIGKIDSKHIVLNKPYFYVSLSSLGLHQVSAGLLVNLPKSI